MTLNGRLDYFGQAVNLAARVQALSQGNDVMLTDEVLEAAGARDLLAGYPLDEATVELKGIQGAVRVHRVLVTQPRVIEGPLPTRVG